MFLLLFFVLLIQFFTYWLFEPLTTFLMFLLLFFVLLIQFFTSWIFEPITSFLDDVLEIRILPVIALIGLILLFSGKSIKH